MFTLDVKEVRRQYNTLSALITRENCDNTITNLTTKARKISSNEIVQIYSERHGMIIDAISISKNNLVFLMIIDRFQGTLELSPYIHIKEPNGQIVATWNIKDEVVTFHPLLK